MPSPRRGRRRLAAIRRACERLSENIARCKSMSDVRAAMRSSARRTAASARSMSISSARSAVSASIVTLFAQHFEEAATDRHVVLFTAFVHADFARLQRGEKRRVVRQDAQLTVDTGRDEHIDILGIYHPLGGYYFKSHSH